MYVNYSELTNPAVSVNSIKFKRQNDYLLTVNEKIRTCGLPQWKCRVGFTRNGTVSQSLYYRGVRFYIKYSSRFGWRLLVGSSDYGYRYEVKLKEDFSQLIGRSYSKLCRDVGEAIWMRDFRLATEKIVDFFG